MGGGSGCETIDRSPVLTSLLSHCSHGGNSFTAETFVNDGLSGHRRRRRPLPRSSLTKVSAVKHAPPCETMDHTRPFQLSLLSRWRGPHLLLENRPRRMLLKGVTVIRVIGTLSSTGILARSLIPVFDGAFLSLRSQDDVAIDEPEDEFGVPAVARIGARRGASRDGDRGRLGRR